MITMKPRLCFLLVLALSGMLADMTWAGEIEILPKEQSKKILEGETLVLSCKHNVVGKTSSDLNIRWQDPSGNDIVAQQGTKFVTVQPDYVLLMLVNVKMSNTGVYTCSATIDNVDKEVTIMVEVYGNVEFLSPSVQTLINGTNDRIWCRSTTTTDNKILRWFEVGPQGQMKPLSDRFVPMYETKAGEEGNYLLVKNVNLGDSKTYTCMMEFLVLGESRKLDIKVTVTVPPKIMPIHLDPTSPKEGDRLLLSCSAEGIPAPTYMFYKGSKALMEQRSSTGEFVFESLKRTDEGLYTCNAHNDGGSQNETIRLDVKILPTFENTNNITQREGTEVRLPCIATGDPVPSMFWRRKGSELDFLSQENSVSDIHVETVTDDPQHDGPTTLYRRTLYLVIPELKSEHAGEYICKADNQFGMKERTFKIDVTYKPNFNDQKTTTYYGWVGSKTNLTCVANGNPEPLITWHRDNKNLADESGYVITVGQSGLSTRVISYLTPVVDNTNVGSVFGEYTCQAANRFDTSNQLLIFKRAEVPDMVTINVVSTKATEMELKVSSPANDGGQPVLRYIIMYSVADSGEDQTTMEKERMRNKPTSVRLTNLKANTRYSIKVYAINNVGQGKEKKIVEKTKDLSRPDAVKVTSSKQGLVGTTYDLTWQIPMTGGVEISNYVVQYSEVKVDTTNSDEWKVVRVSSAWKSRVVEGEKNTHVTLTNLKRDTHYQVKIKAVNRIGASEESTFIFQTGMGDGEALEDDGPALGAGGVVALMVVILLLVAVAVDAAFFKTKQCGLIWTLSRLLGRKDEGAAGSSKSPEDGDEAATKLLGKDKEDTLRTENEVDKDAEEAGKDGTDGGDGEKAEEKKELEPEDKEEKLPIEVATEAAGEKKEAEAPAKESAGETTPSVETKPPSDEKTAKA